nr:hypothetical protein [Tanacetum cinerariifolium]
MIVEDKGNGEKGGSTAETVSFARPDISTVRPDISTARPKDSTAEPKTPTTTTTLFNDKDVTIANTLIDPRRTKDYTIEERSKFLAEFFERRKKHLAKERAEEISSKPPTKTQLRNLMMTYLKHTGRFTHAQLKSRIFKGIQKLYNKEQKWIDAFVLVGSEEDEKRIGSRKKRAAGSSLRHKSPKILKTMIKMKRELEDGDKAINYETLDVKSPIVDCESQVLGTNEAGDIHVYKLTRLDGSYMHFLTLSRMPEVLDRQDVLDLQKIIMERFPANDPKGYDLILWGDLKTLVESSEDNEIWRNQQDWRLLSWKLYETCGVHTLIWMIL